MLSTPGHPDFRRCNLGRPTWDLANMWTGASTVGLATTERAGFGQCAIPVGTPTDERPESGFPEGVSRSSSVTWPASLAFRTDGAMGLIVASLVGVSAYRAGRAIPSSAPSSVS